MTSYESVHDNYTIKWRQFEDEAIQDMVQLDHRLINWPVVYVLSSDKEVYVGETLDYAKRMRQHLDNTQKQRLQLTHVILHDKFNKSACLDLESMLINLFTGDGQRKVLNANHGIVDADYYLRDHYRQIFDDIFNNLRYTHHLFSQSRSDIENSDLYKYSPFKQLNEEQETTVTSISEGIINRLKDHRTDHNEYIVEGGAGTGKTILAVYLMKLISDYTIGNSIDEEGDPFSEHFFNNKNNAARQQVRIGLVIPQASLRDTLKKVFRSVEGLTQEMILSPFDIPKVRLDEGQRYDLLIVDEAHRLNKFAAQANGSLLKKYREYNQRLYKEDDLEGDQHNQLDWARDCSNNLVLLLDRAQAVRPADIATEDWEDAIGSARRNALHFPLTSQMRMRVSEIQRYKQLIDSIFGDRPITDEDVPDFGDYDFRIFTNFQDMHSTLNQRENEYGLSRVLAGYAWPWISKKDKTDDAPYDIELDGISMRWNRTINSWAHSATAFQEVGSIHTIQGYDLNYAAVIIGPDVELDEAGKYQVNRDRYYDRRGKVDNKLANEVTSPEQLRQLVANIYKVLLTRGIRGTYIYAESSGLAERLHQIQEILERRKHPA